MVAKISLLTVEHDDFDEEEEMSAVSSPSLGPSSSAHSSSSSSMSSLPSMRSSWSSIGGQEVDAELNALEILAGIEVQAVRLPEGPLKVTREDSAARKRKASETQTTTKRSKNSPRSVDEVALELQESAAVLAAVGVGEVATIGIYTPSQRAEKIRRYREKKKNRKFNKKVLSYNH
jgi:hypothetical protein